MLMKLYQFSSKLALIDRGSPMVPSSPFKGDFKVYSLLYQAQQKVPMRRPRLPATKNLQSEFASNMLIKKPGSLHPAADRAAYFILHIYWMQNFCATIHLPDLFLDSTDLIGGCSRKTWDRSCCMRSARAAAGSV